MRKVLAHLDKKFTKVFKKQKGRSPGAIFNDSLGNRWLGKYAVDRPTISAKRRTIQEAFGYEVYQNFGVRVPKWHLVKEMKEDSNEKWWLLTEWWPHFKTFEGDLFQTMLASKQPPTTIKDFGRGLAIAKFFSEPDWLGGDGDNAGFIEEENEMILAKIDPANMFEYGWEQQLLGSQLKDIAFNGGKSMFSSTDTIFLFGSIHDELKIEFLNTLKEILEYDRSAFEALFLSILPEPDIVSQNEIDQLMEIIDYRKMKINQIYFSKEPLGLSLTSPKEKFLSQNSLQTLFTQIESLLLFKTTSYQSEVCALPKFSQLWFLNETILFPNIQSKHNMSNCYPTYWLERYDNMTNPHHFPCSPNAPKTAVFCVKGEIRFSKKQDLDDIQIVTQGNWFIFDFKQKEVTLLPSKGVSMLIEIYPLKT